MDFYSCRKVFLAKDWCPCQACKRNLKNFSLYLVQSSGKPSLSLVLLSRRRAAHFCSLKKNSKKVILIRNTLQIEFFPSVYLRIFHDLKFMPFCMDGRSPAGNPQRTTQSLHVNFFFCHFVHSIVSHVQLDWPKLDNIQLEAVRPYCTKPGTQKMCLMALTLYF